MKKNAEEEKNGGKLLEGAYAIETPADSVSYYREFATVYDEQFAEQLGYVYPRMLADVYRAAAQNEDVPILDVGCGTGLVAQSLIDHQSLDIDGLDISAEMLANAADKKLYRHLIEADLTSNMDNLSGDYGAIVSAGTFTFGHLGPQVLPQLLTLGKPGTLYCIGVNSAFCEQQGFNAVLDEMVKQDRITAPDTKVRDIFSADENTDNEHMNDTATVLVYRQK